MNKFKVMEWIRGVRDKNYKKTKHLDKKELLETYKKKADAARAAIKTYKIAQ